MQIKCEYCGEFFSDSEPQCPYCGGPNNQLKRTAEGQPATIEELLQFAQNKNIPLEKIRFFIGVDYREPKAFGIYKDEGTGNFVVYKNKADGSRAVRYEGKDEAYAVNEIYQKLREEILRNNEKNAPANSGTSYNAGEDDETRKNRKKFRLLLFGFILLAAVTLFVAIGYSSLRGTSGNGGGFFYHGGGYERSYDDNDNDGDSGGSDTEYHSDTEDSWDTDWDSGDSWNSDWDSFDSDWDSDW